LGSSKIAPAEYIYNALKYVITERIKELQRFIKFLFVGGTGFFVQVISQEAAVFIGISHVIAAGVGAEAAILSNFLFNHFWTFQDTRQLKDNTSFFGKLIKFNIASFASVIIQIIAVWLGEHFLGIQVRILSFSIPTRILILFPTIILLVIPLNYIIYNKIIWKTHRLKNKNQQ
jgi:putative flippase GtrA